MVDVYNNYDVQRASTAAEYVFLGAAAAAARAATSPVPRRVSALAGPHAPGARGSYQQ